MSRPLLTLADFERSAQGRLAAPVWDFVAGGAGEERTLAANRAEFDRAWLRPSVLTDPGPPDTATKILGRNWAVPVAVAPLAYHTLAHPDGEVATVRAAGAAGVPVVVSTFAGRTVEDLAAAASTPLWLQVYCFRDRETTRNLVERAARAGFEALVLTVDTPHVGQRLRDVRNGFVLPPGIAPANLSGGDYSSPMAHSRVELDPTLDWSVVGWLRSISSLPVLVKGVLTAADARRALAAGVDGIVVSNHGGRQLDGAPPTLSALPEVVEAVAGACPVLLDSGIRRGADVLAALALGADAVLLGRPVLYGLTVDGEAGVREVLRILTDELVEAMALTGTGSVAAAGPHLLRPGQRTPPAGLRKQDLHASVSDPLLDTMTFLNEVTHRFPEAISFAPGRPYDGFFDTEKIFEYLRTYLDHLAAEGATPEDIRGAMYQYGPTAGQIQQVIASALRTDEGIDVAAESIVVTVGAQEAMVLALRALFAGPDDVLLVASPCYVGIVGAARLLDVTVRGVEERPDGLSVADVEAALDAERARGRRPRALYVVPDHSNPSGVTVSLHNREALLDLAARRDFLILEDSPYRLVSPGTQLPSLKALDRERRVVQLGSFAKTVFPGARVGYVIADQHVVDEAGRRTLLAAELSKIKSMVTVNTSPLSQAAVAGAILSGGGHISGLTAQTAAHYGEAMRHTLSRLELELPEDRRAELGVDWNTPSGGFFLTVRVGFPADNAALTRSAREFGVLWTPMSYFHPEGGGERGIRLSVSYLTPGEIDTGISRLVRFLEAETARSAGGDER